MSDPTPPKRRRWVMPLLGVSLAVNLLIVGMAAGAAWRVKDMGGGKMRQGPSGAVFLRALEPQDRKAIFGELRAGRDTARRFERENGANMLTALRADPFDPSALQTLIEARAEMGQTSKAALDAKWLDVVSGMDGAERAAYADRLEKAFERRKGNRSKPRDD